MTPPERLIVHVAEHRCCVGPFPCGRGAGAYEGDLPCTCESIADSPRVFVPQHEGVVSVTFTAGESYLLSEEGDVYNAYGTYLGRFAEVDDV